MDLIVLVYFPTLQNTDFHEFIHGRSQASAKIDQAGAF